MYHPSMAFSLMGSRLGKNNIERKERALMKAIQLLSPLRKRPIPVWGRSTQWHFLAMVFILATTPMALSFQSQLKEKQGDPGCGQAVDIPACPSRVADIAVAPAETSEPQARGEIPTESIDLPYEPTSNYEERSIRGWRVLVHKSLLEEHEALGCEALELLDFQLYQITRVVPEPALAKLRQIPIWLEYDNPRVTCACYHPSRGWLKANGFNPEKAGSVEIGNAKRFLSWTREQPWMVLHELAHGYHHRFLGGYGQPEIVQAWQEARDAGLYDSVLHIRGHRQVAYAKKDPQEYFAELSEAWFGVNDFYPFVRGEVWVHDPKGAALLEKLWGTRTRPPRRVSDSAGEGND